MRWDSSKGKFKYGSWKIPWSKGKTVAAACRAYDNKNLASNWKNKYPLFTVTSGTTTTLSSQRYCCILGSSAQCVTEASCKSAGGTKSPVKCTSSTQCPY
jgi:hypothetical protein